VTAVGMRRPRESLLAPPLLETKLHPPPAREQIIPRARLLDRLRAGPAIKLTVVAAPPGYGKTTLLGAWRELAEETRPVAWVTLDEHDNDPVVVWSYVVEAVRRVYPALELSVSPQAAGPSRIVELLLPELVNALTDAGQVGLVLDDFHRISSRPVCESVAWFVENAPATFQLLIATRNEPALHLSTLRAHGALVELRARELGFTPAEAELLLNERLELGVDRADVGDLVRRTEGWPAGMYLAALSLRAVEDRRTFLQTFGAQNRDVVDFLVDEVLEAHDPELQELMLRSSVLERLCGRLCDAVLEREGSAEELAALARTNLFLVPLDDHGEWYRFHQLFAQLLRVELEHREPGLARTLHRRAHAWHREHGSVEEAIEHALRAGAFDDARDTFAQVWFRVATVGRHATVLAWLERFPPEFVEQDAHLLHAQTWLFLLLDKREAAADRMAALERLGWPDDAPLPDGSSSLEASLATMRAAFPGGDVGAWYDNARAAVELQGDDSAFWAGACWPCAMACYYRGDPDEADEWFAKTVEAGVPHERWGLVASALAYKSLIAGERGRLDEQRFIAERAARTAREHGLDERQGEVHFAVGASLAARGKLTEALPFFEHAVAVLRAFGRSIELGDAVLRGVAVLESLGYREGAADLVDEARAVIDSCPDPGVLRQRLEAVEQPRRAHPRPRDNGLTDRELVVLRMLRGPLTEREIGRELYLSHNTIHSHTKSIYRKLGVSARSEATEKAHELGLI
jgi:ATP/maltotriose-dependent transcriptional regulator MalT